MNTTQGQKIARIISIICSALLVITFFLPYVDSAFVGEYSLAGLVGDIPEDDGGPVVLIIWAVLPAIAMLCAIFNSKIATIIFNFISSAYILYFNLSLTDEMSGGFSDMGIASTLYTLIPIILIIVTIVIIATGSSNITTANSDNSLNL